MRDLNGFLRKFSIFAILLFVVARADITHSQSITHKTIDSLNKWTTILSQDNFTDNAHCEIYSPNKNMMSINHKEILIWSKELSDIEYYMVRFDNSPKILRFKPSREELENGFLKFNGDAYRAILIHKRMRIRLVSSKNILADDDFDLASLKKLIHRMPKQCPAIVKQSNLSRASYERAWSERGYNSPNVTIKHRAIPDEFSVDFIKEGSLDDVGILQTFSSPLKAAGRALLFTEVVGGSGEPKAMQGHIHWKLDTESAGKVRQRETIVRATVEFAETGLSLDLTIRRNTDSAFPASHIIGMNFRTAGSTNIAVRETGVPQFKNDENARGQPLSAINSALGDNLFVAALSNVPFELERNKELFLNMKWIDIPVRFSSGRIGIITLEKNDLGASVIKRAFNIWH